MRWLSLSMDLIAPFPATGQAHSQARLLRSASSHKVLALALCAAAGCQDPVLPSGSTDVTPSDPSSDDGDDDSSSSSDEGTTSGARGTALDAGKGSGSRTQTDSGAKRIDASARSDASVLDGDAGIAPLTDATMGPAVVPVACTPNAYVSNSYSDSVSVIDTNTHKVVATVPTGKAPINPTFTPDRRQVYVANSQADTLTVIDVETHKATNIPAGGMSPSGLAFSPDGDTLYISYIGENFVAPGSVGSLQLSTGKASAPIPMGTDPERIALTSWPVSQSRVSSARTDA